MKCARDMKVKFVHNEIPCGFLFILQDPRASFDVNGHDPDPQPRYDFTNENRYA